jgi:autotransporter adhesin
MNGSTGRISGVSNGIAASDVATFGQLTSAVNTLDGKISLLDGRLVRVEGDTERALQGVAMGFALNSAPMSLSAGESGVAVGVGTFEDEYAGAVRFQYQAGRSVGFGANVGFSKNAVGGGLGASFKF